MSNTVMGQAMEKAGAALPLNQRVWLWVKDHPKSSVKDITAALKADGDQVGIMSRNLASRGMLESDYETRKVAHPYARGGAVNRQIVVYSVPPGMKEYELLPVRKKKNPRAKATAKTPPPMPAAPAAPPAAQAQMAAPSLAAMTRDLQQKRVHDVMENMTIRELRELWKELNKFFGGQ